MYKGSSRDRRRPGRIGLAGILQEVKVLFTLFKIEKLHS